MDDSLKNVGLPYATKMSRVWIHRKGPQLIYLRKSENCAKCLKRSFIGIVLHGSVKNSEQLYGGKFSSTHRYIWSALKFMPACSFVQDVRLRRAISMLDAKQPMKFREFRSDCKVGNRNFPINSDWLKNFLIKRTIWEGTPWHWHFGYSYEYHEFVRKRYLRVDSVGSVQADFIQQKVDSQFPRDSDCSPVDFAWRIGEARGKRRNQGCNKVHIEQQIKARWALFI